MEQWRAACVGDGQVKDAVDLDGRDKRSGDILFQREGDEWRRSVQDIFYLRERTRVEEARPNTGRTP
jgi:hypothetical protein